MRKNSGSQDTKSKAPAANADVPLDWFAAVLPAPVSSTDPSPAAVEQSFSDGELAEIFHEVTMACSLQSTAPRPFQTRFSFQSFQLYLAGIVRDADVVKDPIARMLVEQIVLAHHAVARLQGQAAFARSAEEAALYVTAAARLLGELRRTALALREYRSPAAPRQVTVVGQQNVSAGDQQIALLENPGNKLAPPEKHPDIKESPAVKAIAHEPQQPAFVLPQPASLPDAVPVEARAEDG